MKTRIFSIIRRSTLPMLALFIILATASGCERGVFCTSGKGDLVTVTLELPEFSGVENQCSADIVLTQGETRSVTVTAQQNIIDRLERTVSRDIWEVDLDGCVTRHKDILIEITMPDLTHAGISGSGSITATSRFTELEDVELSISGSGDIALDMDARSVQAKITGSGNMDLDLTAQSLIANTTGSGEYRLTGIADVFQHNVSGSGKCSAFGLSTRDCDITVSGSGDCEITVSETLDVKISGSGNVYYKGQPGINVTITGSGNLINAN